MEKSAKGNFYSTYALDAVRYGVVIAAAFFFASVSYAMKSKFYCHFVESLSLIYSMFYFLQSKYFHTQLSQQRLAKNGEMQLKK